MFKITTDERYLETHNVIIFHMEGKIILSNDAISTLGQMVFGQRNHHIILDFGGILVVDPAGVGMLVNCYTTLTHKGRDLRFLRVPHNLVDLFQKTGLNSVFHTFDNEHEAVLSCRAL
ncbi:MAG: STAS domain-containing protein [Candidatus Paceibacterota bacterium]|jgi:anti-anti-sigma factor